MRNAFDQLTPALQYQIVNTLGFRELRPVQHLTIDAVLSGENCVVLAPTAGGKTEASFFPILSAMDAHDWHPVSVLYLSPIRALLNNQEHRVTRYAGLLGRRAFKWHGDTPPTARRRFCNDPSDILLTTPESLEAMLMSTRVPARRLFAGLQAVIIDEVHAFADDDRGAHLAAVLERLSRFCNRDVQRIGLSATVGNPQEILRWLQGSSRRSGQVVSPPKPKVDPQIRLDYVGSLANAATVIRLLHPGKKRLVFVDSRRGVEELGKMLLQAGVMTHVIHGSLAASARRDAEKAFAEGSDCVIVATSALELGIDVGDLDHVLQIDSPSTVASFLQRMGRTGRREGTVPNCTFLATKDTTCLQAAALIALHDAGYVEPVKPSQHASHILAHQLMALGIQHEGVATSDWWAWVAGATSFEGLEEQDRHDLVNNMLLQGILTEQQGRLWLGPRGEKLYGKRNFAELYAVFSTPRLITVLANHREVGTIDANFLQGLDANAGPRTFTLAGQPWRVTAVDWRRGTCQVTPSERAGSTRWAGAPQYLSRALCQAMRQQLVSDELDPRWSKRATKTLTQLRSEHVFLREAEAPMVSCNDEITWWNHAGGRANLLLAQLIEHEFGGKVVTRNEALVCKQEAGQSELGLKKFLARLANAGRPILNDAYIHAESAARSRVSKFEPCLPEKLLTQLLAEIVVDVTGAAAAVRQV